MARVSSDDMNLRANLASWNTYSIRKLLIAANQDPLLDPLLNAPLAVGYSVFGGCFSRVSKEWSHICQLLVIKNSADLIRSEYADFINIFDPLHRLDKWLLITFGHFDTRYRPALETTLGNWYFSSRTTLFHAEQIRSEISEAQRTCGLTGNKSTDELRTFMRFVVVYGNLEMWNYFHESCHAARTVLDRQESFYAR
jgi:hypothetical protein